MSPFSRLVTILRWNLHQQILHSAAANARRGVAVPAATGRTQACSPEMSHAELETFDAHAPQPDEAVIAEEGIECVLKQLDRQDPSLPRSPTEWRGVDAARNRRSSRAVALGRQAQGQADQADSGVV